METGVNGLHGHQSAINHAKTLLKLEQGNVMIQSLTMSGHTVMLMVHLTHRIKLSNVAQDSLALASISKIYEISSVRL